LLSRSLLVLLILLVVVDVELLILLLLLLLLKSIVVFVAAVVAGVVDVDADDGDDVKVEAVVINPMYRLLLRDTNVGGAESK
jgi:hypothetical protein